MILLLHHQRVIRTDEQVERCLFWGGEGCCTGHFEALDPALAAGRRAIEAGIADPESVLAIVRKILAGEPAIRIDYAAVCDAETLEPLERIDRQAVILGAIRLGSVRLIDNVLARRKR